MRISTLAMIILISFEAKTQNVGLGTQTPLARLHVVDSSVIFSAAGSLPFPPGNVPISGTGRRMFWYPDKAAFRAGAVFGPNWDKDNIGNYSFASGGDTKAIGDNSTAMGFGTTASGIYSLATGYLTIAAGQSSVAFGNTTTASGDYSTAIGSNTLASGGYSFAMGTHTNATNTAAVAFGSNNTASGYASIAGGFQTVASGDYSVALGTYVSTAGSTGAFVFGDNSTTTLMTAGANVFRARFASGYRFYTSSDYSTSALLPAGANAWNTASDVRLKENFAEVDGEDFLHKIAGIHLTSWNYKKQDPKTWRHYGPMAQDFFAAFGKDQYGNIGNDTTINQADFEGVSFIAIQALEKRTESLKAENDKLMKENAMLNERLARLEKMILNKQ